MSHPVSALGVAVLCASGYVWYVPAIMDVHAGADRPGSRRLAALACLTGWGTGVLLVPLLLTSAPWAVSGSFAALGAAVSGGQAVRSRVRRRTEAREEAQRWATLGRPRAAAGCDQP
ncbi:hypothetical protein [Streptomyces erythrochromogenes]|uniref:hypothetical protein n=1 Tax=Streptomyces erythrochromogenes TaxID=285574 RepID=UPI0036AF9316